MDNVVANLKLRRTYGDGEEEGEIVREGFDPQQLEPAGPSTAVRQKDEEGRPNDRRDSPDPPSKGPQYGNLDDRHVWDSKDVK